MLAPIGEFLFVDLQVQFGDTQLQPFLHIHDRLVVDTLPDLFLDEPEQRAGRDVADSLLCVLVEVALYGCNGGVADSTLKFNGHEGLP